MIILRIHLGSSSLALEAACPGHQQYSTRQNERRTSLPPTQPSSEARDGSRRAFPPAELNSHGGRWRQYGDPALMPITQITSHCKDKRDILARCSGFSYWHWEAASSGYISIIPSKTSNAVPTRPLTLPAHPPQQS